MSSPPGGLCGRRPGVGRVALLYTWTVVGLSGCGPSADARTSAPPPDSAAVLSDAERRLTRYAEATLSPSVDHLGPGDHAAIRFLIQATRQMDEVFWIQAYGDREFLPANLTDAERTLVERNYGPWDRLDNDAPLLPGIEPRPPGGNFYPALTTGDDFEEAGRTNKTRLLDPYAMVHSGERGGLRAVPYHIEFRGQHTVASSMLEEAAKLVSNEGFRGYLRSKQEGLGSDDYAASDSAWAELEGNAIDVLIGPMPSSEDRLMGVKTAHSGMVLLRDVEWRARLERMTDLLPALARELDVLYEGRSAGSRSMPARVEVFQALYAAGAARAGAVPAVPALHGNPGSGVSRRRLILENVEEARFQRILEPIADVLIDPVQRPLVTFDALFTQRVLHELAHWLGPSSIADSVPVATALRAYHSAIDDAKADVLGLLLAEALIERGELGVTVDAARASYLATLIFSARSDAPSAETRARMVQLTYLMEQGAVTRDDEAGTYRVEAEAMSTAIASLATLLLDLQREGNTVGAGRILAERGRVPAPLRANLATLESLGLPAALTLTQGWDQLRHP